MRGHTHLCVQSGATKQPGNAVLSTLHGQKWRETPGAVGGIVLSRGWDPQASCGGDTPTESWFTHAILGVL